MTLLEIEEQALRLDPPTRARLAERLLVSLDMLSAREVEALWLDEAERRDLELDRGEAQSYSADEVLRELRATTR